MAHSAGAKFRQALQQEHPLQIVGTVNAYTAMMAKKAGFQAIYLSGGALAAVSHGLPDLGITDLNDTLTDVLRITYATDLPLIVDIDTGFGNTLTIERTVKTLIRAGAAGIQIEDQVQTKRCGHRPNKQCVSTEEMCVRIQTAHAAKTDPNFYIIARTDALATEGLDSSVVRAQAYIAAGADAIFLEAATQLNDYAVFTKQISVPVLANMTEFGKTPLQTKAALQQAGVGMILYPLTVTRAMNQAAWQALTTLRAEGDQLSFIDDMQTREALYQNIDYYSYENKV